MHAQPTEIGISQQAGASKAVQLSKDVSRYQCGAAKLLLTLNKQVPGLPSAADKRSKPRHSYATAETIVANTSLEISQLKSLAVDRLNLLPEANFLFRPSAELITARSSLAIVT